MPSLTPSFSAKVEGKEMVEIPINEYSTVEKIYTTYEQDAAEAAEESTREHLGASMIGANCDRKLWYSFRWSTTSKYSGRILRLFETGNLAEARFTDNLRRIGVVVQDIDPETGRQWAVRDTTGHFGGAMDAIALGFPEAPKTWHVVEYKTHNDKSFKDLVRKGVQLSKPLHYAQMQVYAHLKKLTLIFYLSVNKNTDELYQERVPHNAEYANRLVERAQRIIDNPNPPERIRNDPCYFECKMCSHKAICYGDSAPDRHCRSCVFSSPVANGEWYCNKHNQRIPLKTQKEGCGFHRYLPRLLVQAEQIDAAEDFAWIEYKLPDGEIWRDEG